MAALEVVVNEIMMPVSYFPRLFEELLQQNKEPPGYNLSRIT
jgi:hypothetical protein